MPLVPSGCQAQRLASHPTVAMASEHSRGRPSKSRPELAARPIRPVCPHTVTESR